MAQRHSRWAPFEFENLFLLRDGHAHASRDAVLHNLLRGQVAGGAAISAMCDTAISGAVGVEVRKTQRRRPRYIQPGALPRDQDRKQDECSAANLAQAMQGMVKWAISECVPETRRRLLGPQRTRRLARWIGAVVRRRFPISASAQSQQNKNLIPSLYYAPTLRLVRAPFMAIEYMRGSESCTRKEGFARVSAGVKQTRRSANGEISDFAHVRVARHRHALRQYHVGEERRR